jgi:hypothetical protein
MGDFCERGDEPSGSLKYVRNLEVQRKRKISQQYFFRLRIVSFFGYSVEEAQIREINVS